MVDIQPARPGALTSIPAADLNLDSTLQCGQVFHWTRHGAGYAGTIGHQPVYLEQRGDRLLLPVGCEEIVSRYLALDHPLGAIRATFPDDDLMRTSSATCVGLRIIRQPLWECLATFITSALKQVAHIALISHLLRQRFGGAVGSVDGVTLFAYPDATRVAGLQEADLRQCGLGFRAKSLLGTAQRLHAAAGRGEDLLTEIRLLDRPEALRTLTSFPGVGTKVANCVLLFAYEHLDAFPIDVWIERVLRETYFSSREGVTLPELQKFADGHFGPYRGYAQQYLFHHARMTTPRRRSVDKADAPAPDRQTTPTRRVRPAPARRTRSRVDVAPHDP